MMGTWWKRCDRRTDRQTDGRTDGRTGGRNEPVKNPWQKLSVSWPAEVINKCEWPYEQTLNFMFYKNQSLMFQNNKRKLCWQCQNKLARIPCQSVKMLSPSNELFFEESQWTLSSSNKDPRRIRKASVKIYELCLCLRWFPEAMPKMLPLFPLDKMAAISQTIFPDAFLWMQNFILWLKFLWSVFITVQLTITHHSFI